MQSHAFETSLIKRFRLAKAPTLEAQLSGTAPIVFSRMMSNEEQPGRSVSPSPENAFTFQIPLIHANFSELKYANRTVALPEVQEPGRAFLFDLSARPTVGLSTKFDNVRAYIAQATIDDLAYERGLRSIGGLTQRIFGTKDPILFRIAQLLVPVLAAPDTVSRAFIEYISLAFHDHIIRLYGGASVSTRPYQARLAPWQVRRVTEFVEENLDQNPSISELAQLSGLSSSYFAQVFKQTMGVAPHQWLMRRRIEGAKIMLGSTDLSSVHISGACGFSDPSHFARVFMRLEGCSPREWRRLHRS
jgi:AraC family transcriptional regulator